ncbi:MAG: MATE family efflux transporter [Butyricicoccaceae bacterium]
MGMIARWIEPRRDQVPAERQMFSNMDLKQLILPLIVEQVLVMMVGMVGTVMVSHAGEAAMSGVSLSDMINNVFQYVFSALATGGTIVVSQYIGRGDLEKGRRSAGQLVMIATLLSLFFLGAVVIGDRALLGLLFGRVDADVMEAARTYLRITAFSYPFMAAYNALAALFRAMGQSKVNMRVSLGMNVVNVLCNAVGVFLLEAGVVGVALSALIARASAACVLLVLLRDKKYAVSISMRDVLGWDGAMLRRILSIAVPSGIESGLFQVCRVALTSIIATFGTAQIAANGVAVSIDNINTIVNSAIGLAIPAVVGRCVGAGDHDQAAYYTRKLLRIAQIGSTVLVAGVMAALPFVLRLYALSDEARWYAGVLVALHGLWTILLGTTSGPLPTALRSAGDVRFTMTMACLGLVIGRVGGSYLFSIVLDMGVIGMWLAMPTHWIFNSLGGWLRFRSGKWREKRVI